ncbi:unnamed protein product, partial [Vitis vinifera]
MTQPSRNHHQLDLWDKLDCSTIQLCCDMDNHRPTVGFSCLPSELLQSIFLRLALPDIVRLRSINKSIASIVSDKDFVRDCNTQFLSANWLFIYSKGWRRDSVLHGFTDQSDHWFKIPIAGLLMPVIHATEDLYFLAASGNFFLFVSNTRKELLSVNLMKRTVKKIPPSPLGPRGTSSWRRSGMKLVAGPPGSDSFRFLFAELVENRPIMFEYNSDDDKWQSMEAEENHGDLPRVFEGAGPLIFLSVVNGTNESVVLAIGSQGNNTPVVLRPRFSGGAIEQRQVARVLKEIEMWGLSPNGRRWERISKLPGATMEQIKRAYGVIMGCVEERNGTIRALLMSNYRGLWHIIWLSYDIGRDDWTLLPLPDFDMKGLNMAGITFSSGLTLHHSHMGPYDSAISTGSTTSSPSSAAKPSDIDGLLAGAGYKVRSTELHQVAQRLERLETVMVNAPSEISQLASDVLHCNPSDIASWVDSMLFEFNPPVSIPSDLSDFSDLTYIDSVVTSRLEDVKPWMLQVSPKEAVAINSIMQLHRLLGSGPTRVSAIETVLGWIRSLNPKIVTVVEQEANHNQSEFLDRFTEALYYYSTMFDSLEACSLQPEKAVAEIYIQKEICNVLCCEGSARVERHEPLAKWRNRLGAAGFRPLNLGSNAFKQASMLLTLFSAEGYCVEEHDGCLTLGWHSRPLIAASAWQPLLDTVINHNNLL